MAIWTLFMHFTHEHEAYILWELPSNAIFSSGLNEVPKEQDKSNVDSKLWTTFISLNYSNCLVISKVTQKEMQLMLWTNQLESEKTWSERAPLSPFDTVSSNDFAKNE